MTIRQDLLTAAAKSKTFLEDSSELVADYLRLQINEDGGFKGRTDASDLYYTLFGIQGLIALDAPFHRDKVTDFLNSFKNTESMDLVSLACIIRCKADISDAKFDDSFISQLEKCRSDDGGFNNEPHSKTGTAYGCFLAMGAYQDIQTEIPDPKGLTRCLDSLKTDDSAYSNDTAIHAASVPASAAAITVLHYLAQPINETSLNWLADRITSEGGFSAASAVPFADLLSTATGLHALRLADYPIENLRERCLDYVETLWNGAGAFCGSSADKTCDTEYTFYALLALGNLVV